MDQLVWIVPAVLFVAQAVLVIWVRGLKTEMALQRMEELNNYRASIMASVAVRYFPLVEGETLKSTMSEMGRRLANIEEKLDQLLERSQGKE